MPEHGLLALLGRRIRVARGPVCYVLDPADDFAGWAWETDDGRLVAVSELDGRIRWEADHA